MSTTGPQDSPTWPPAPPQQPLAGPSQPGPQDRVASPGSTPPGGLPAAARESHLRRPRRHPGRIAAAAAGLVVLAGAGTAIALGGVGPRVERREIFSHQVTALTIDAGAGDVTVRSGARTDTVEVIRRARGSLSDAPAARGTWDGTTLVIRPECPDGCGADYEIRLPNGVAVTAETGSGDIELGGTLGTVSLEAGSGDVEADVAVDNLTTRTGSGDMGLRLRSAPALLSATSGSGDIAIRVPSAQTYAVAVDTGSGDTDIDVPRQDTASHRVQLRTGSGDISMQAR